MAQDVDGDPEIVNMNSISNICIRQVSNGVISGTPTYAVMAYESVSENPCQWRLSGEVDKEIAVRILCAYRDAINHAIMTRTGVVELRVKQY
jgi:hypothetical protein